MTSRPRKAFFYSLWTADICYRPYKAYLNQDSGLIGPHRTFLAAKRACLQHFRFEVERNQRLVKRIQKQTGCAAFGKRGVFRRR